MEEKIIWNLSELFLTFNPKTKKNEIKSSDLLTDKERMLASLICELDNKKQELKSIKIEYQSLEEKIIERIVKNIRCLVIDSGISLNDFQTKIIDETRTLLDNFKDIKTSFSTSVVRILKSAIDRKKINAELSKEDIENIITKLEDLHKDKKEDREKNNKMRELLESEVNSIMENLKSVYDDLIPEELQLELNKQEEKLKALYEEQKLKTDEYKIKLDDLLKMDTRTINSDNMSNTSILTTVDNEIKIHNARTEQLRALINITKKK